MNPAAEAVRRDALTSARVGRLRYVHDGGPGIRRRRCGKGFQYFGADGRSLRERDILTRIRALAIPPAWTDVWICPLAHGHIQATGRDARGRKQYRYHARWREVRDEEKFDRMLAFARALPGLRVAIDEALRGPPLARQTVIATVIRLLEMTSVRVGNEEYARHNQSYGLTTLRDEHVVIDGPTIRFEFVGKGGKPHALRVRDRRLARIVQRCQDLEGQELFRYLSDDGQLVRVESGDVNAYLREVTRHEFTAKDFRTWRGTVLAASELVSLEFESETQAKRNMVQAIRKVSDSLRNTPAVCQRSYVHPLVLETYRAGELKQAFSGARRTVTNPHALTADERAVEKLLAAHAHSVTATVKAA